MIKWFKRTFLNYRDEEERHTSEEIFKHVNRQYEDELTQRYIDKVTQKALRLFRYLDTQYVLLIFHKFCAQRLANIQTEMLEYEKYPELHNVYKNVTDDLESTKLFIEEAYRRTRSNENERDQIIEEIGL